MAWRNAGTETANKYVKIASGYLETGGFGILVKVHLGLLCSLLVCC